MTGFWGGYLVGLFVGVVLMLPPLHAAMAYL